MKYQCKFCGNKIESNLIVHNYDDNKNNGILYECDLCEVIIQPNQLDNLYNTQDSSNYNLNKNLFYYLKQITLLNFIFNLRKIDSIYQGHPCRINTPWVEASTGLGVTNQLHHGRERGGVEAKLRHTQGTRYTSNQGSKNFHAEKTSATEGSFGTSFEPGFGMKGKVRVEQQGSNSSIEAEMSGTAELSVSELNTMLLTSTWVSRLVTVFGQVISKGAKVFQGGTGQKVGAFVGMIRNISPGSIVQSHYAAGALKRLKSFGGINIGHKLAIKAKSSNGKLSGEISLERFQSLEFGKDQNDTVHLLLKNIDPVIKMPF